MHYPANLLITLVFAIIYYNGYTQAIDYSPVYRSINSRTSFRISYENDFFSASDRDYTQGVYLELIHPLVKRFPISRIIWQPRSSQQYFGLAIETNGYTPNSIDKPDIQYQDRPYASVLLLRTFNAVVKQQTRVKITNTISLGVLGPLAGGKEIQSSIHRWIGYTKPLGWHNQVKNEPVLNYQLNYEKALTSRKSKHLLITLNGMMRAGTLSTKAVIGPAIMFGSFQDPYNEQAHRGKELNVYVYNHAGINLIAYDATLQGGIFNRHSPYTIAAGDLSRLVFQNRLGLVISFNNTRFEYWQSFMTREYKSGIEPKTGGIQVAFKL